MAVFIGDRVLVPEIGCKESSHAYRSIPKSSDFTATCRFRADTNGNAILVGGDNECGDANLVTQCVYRNAYEAQHDIPFPNGYHDVRRYVPGDPNGMSILAHMYDLNSATGQPNTARDCCIQLPNDPTPIDQSCVPDSGCSPRCGPPGSALLSAIT